MTQEVDDLKQRVMGLELVVARLGVLIAAAGLANVDMTPYPTIEDAVPDFLANVRLVTTTHQEPDATP